MARMSIDDKFARDPRVIRLGKRFRWSRRETMGALIDVFQIAYDRVQDIVPAEDIDTTAELDGFAAAMIEVDLAEQTRAGVRIKGAADRINYLTGRADAGRSGGVKSGESRRNKREAKRSTASEATQAAVNPPDPVPDVVPALAVDPDPEDQIPLPRAIPPSTEHHPVPQYVPPEAPIREPEPVIPRADDAPDLETRRATNRALMAELGAARVRAAEALGVTIQPLLAFDGGERDLVGRLSVPRTGGEFALFVGQARHAIAMAELETRLGVKQIEWLTGAVFSERNLRRLVASTPASIRQAADAMKAKAAQVRDIARRRGDPALAPAAPPKPRPKAQPERVIPLGDRAGAAEIAAAKAALSSVLGGFPDDDPSEVSAMTAELRDRIGAARAPPESDAANEITDEEPRTKEAK